MKRISSSQSSATHINSAKPLTIGWGLEPAMHAGHDYLRTTGHTADPGRDYRNFRETGAKVARSGLRTRVANPARGAFDFSEAEEQALAAKQNGIFVYWDLAHYDHPRWIEDPWSKEIVDAFVELGVAFADRMHEIGCRDFGICVWNEIVLWSSWMESKAGRMVIDYARMGEHAMRWQELGIKATFEVMKAVREKYPHVEFLIAEPCFEAQLLDFLARMRDVEPELMREVVVGLNAYPGANPPHSLDASYYIGFVSKVRSVLPGNRVIFSETGSADVMFEGWPLPNREDWLSSIARVAADCAIDTMIWYPALNHGAWHDETHIVKHGGWDQDGSRTGYAPLIEAVKRVNGVKEAEAPAVAEERDLVELAK